MNYEIFRNKFLRKTLASWCAFATLATMCGPAFAISGALDSGNAVLTRTSSNVGGSISGTAGNFTMTSGNAAVLDWQKLSLGSGESLTYSTVGSWYNVVSGPDASTIAGSIIAKGVNNNVYIFNPNGIVFNSGSSVDVGGIFGAFATGLSNLPTKDSDWTDKTSVFNKALASGSWEATPGEAMSGDITVNGGTISASQIAMAGKNVAVSGGTFAKGSAMFAAGDKVMIDGFGGGTISLTISPEATAGDMSLMGAFENALVAKAGGTFTQTGALTANGKSVTIAANKGITLSENVTASTLTLKGGTTQTGGSVTADKLALDAAGKDVSLDQSGNSVSKIEGTAESLTLVTKTAVAQDAAIEVGTLDVTATGKDITLTDAGNKIGTFKGEGAAVAVQNAQDLELGNINATTLTATATDGDVFTDGAAVTVSGTGDALTLKAEKGHVAIDAGTISANNGNMTLTAQKGVHVGSSAKVTTGNLTLKANDATDAAAIDFDNANVEVTGTLTAEATGKVSIQGTSAVSAKGNVSVTAGGNFEMDATLGDDKVTLQSTEGDVTIAAGHAVLLKKNAVVSGKELNVTATGNEAENLVNIDQDASSTIEATGNATFTAKNGDITLAGEKNDFSKGGVDKVVNAEAKNVTINEGGDTSIAGNTGISLGTVKATAGDVKVTDTTGTITADGATVDATKYVELAATETGKGIAISGGAQVTADNKVKLTTASDTGDVTINGAGTLVKAGRFEVDPTTGEVKNETAYGILVIDSKHDVKITDGAQAGANGYATLGNAVAVNIDAANDVTVNNATLAGNKRVLIDAAKAVAVENGARVLSNYDITIGADTTPETLKVTDNGTQLAAKGDLTADAGAITIENNAKVASDKTTALTAKTGDIAVKSAAKVLANEHVALVAANDVAIGDAATANDTFVKAGENIRMESQNGSVDIVSKVTAGKNLTIVSEKADAGSKVKIDAQYLDDKNILTAEDGSVYVAAEANDIEINNGAVITATDSTKTDSSAAGNILLESKSGSVTPAEGTATIIADNGKGVAALVGGGTVGNKNLTIKAGVTVLNSTGKGVDTPDVKAIFEGDTKFVANAVNDVDVDIVGGTLTIDSQANALAGEKVNEVLYDPSATPSVSTQPQELEAYADDSRGAEAGNDIKITGQNANLVIANNSAAIAGHDVKTVIDGDTTVFGTVQAGHNDYLTTGGNLATPGAGKIVAGKDLHVDVGSSTPMVNIAVGKGVSARSGEREIAFRTVGGYEYPEVYGNNSETAVFIDGRVAGGNSTDFSILQGYEQALVAGNFFLMPVFTQTGNIFPLLNYTDMQSPSASFAQGYLSSDKGKITGLDDAESVETARRP